MSRKLYIICLSKEWVYDDTGVFSMEHEMKGDLGIPWAYTHKGLQKIQKKTSHCGKCWNLNPNFPVSMSFDLTVDVRNQLAQQSKNKI